MRLDEMLDRTDVDPMQIDGICVDSREITPGDLFIAIKGSQFDGHDFVDQALRRGRWQCVLNTKSPVRTIFRLS